MGWTVAFSGVPYGGAEDDPLTCISIERKGMAGCTAGCFSNVRPQKTPTMIIAAALLALVLFVTLLASGRGWSDVLSPTRNELVFAGRNQAYGAYRMRREHHSVMIVAFFTSLGLVSAGLALPKLLSRTVEARTAPPVDVVDVDLTKIFIDQPAKKVQNTSPARRNPNDMIAPIAVDTTEKAPVDTTTRAVDPGPTGPIGTGTDTLAGKGPDTGGGGSTGSGIVEGWQADVSPDYPGGLKALYAELDRTIRYPEIDIDRGKQGRVTVGFVVAEDGSMIDIVILQGVSPTIDAEALRAVRKLKKWKPGKFKGQDVKVRFTLPINFKLSRE